MKKLLILWAMLIGVASAVAQTTAEKLDQLISAYASLQEFRGTALVANKGQVILEKSYGTTADTATIYEIASITKTFTSAVVLKLAELGQLSLQDRLSKYYPEYPHGDSITIAELLNHTAGIYDYIHNQDFMFKQSYTPKTEREMLALFEHQPLDFRPGTGWSYSNSGYLLLGYIIQKVTGMSYQQAVRKYIFTPLKMMHTGFAFNRLDSAGRAKGYYAKVGKDYSYPTPLVDSSVTFAAGSIYSTVGDLYKWHLGLQYNRIISAASQAAAYTSAPYHHYGYGWQIDSLYSKRIVSHSGGIFGFRSNFARIPEDDVCIVLLSNTETPTLDEMTRNIVALLYGQSYHVPEKKKTVQLPEAILKTYAGTYVVKAQSLKLEVKVENGTLVVYPFHGPRSQMAASDETHFFIEDQQDFEVEFKKDASGKVTQMLMTNNGNTRAADKTDL